MAILNPEDKGGIFLRNTGIKPRYMMQKPRRLYPFLNRPENVKSYIFVEKTNL